MRRTALRVMMLIALALPLRSEVADPAENAALHYWRAFQWETTLGEGSHTNAYTLVDESLQGEFSEQAVAFFERVEPFLDELRIGAAKPYCDWGTVSAPVEWIDTLHLSRGHSLVRLSKARFKHLISLNKDADAVALLKSAFQLSRRLDDGKLNLAVLRRNAAETTLMITAAEELPRIGSEELIGLGVWWDRQNWRPDPRRLSETFQRDWLMGLSPIKEAAAKAELSDGELADLSGQIEKVFWVMPPSSSATELRQFIRELESDIEQMGAILNNPDLAEAQKAFKALEDEPENPAIKNPAAFLDSALVLVRHARAVEVRARMFRAAIATVLDGPEALAEHPEPNIGRRFIYEAQFRDRFMLETTDETIDGRPITLQVGRPPDIHTAAAAGDLEQINYLLESGTPVDHPDSERWTSLHHAAQAGKREAVELLLKHGANIDALLSSKGGFMMDPAMAKRYGLKLAEVKLDEDARTALDLAMEAGHEALAEFLRQQGAKTSMELQKAVSTPRD